jgi:hypothetical protein
VYSKNILSKKVWPTHGPQKGKTYSGASSMSDQTLRSNSMQKHTGDFWQREKLCGQALLKTTFFRRSIG